MNIKYWSDIACPFCYIGSNRMKKAMKQIGIYDDAELELKSFQLDPSAPIKTTTSMTDHFAENYQLSKTQAKEQIAQITKMGEDDGLTFNLAEAIPTNTLDAHRLIKLAQSKGDKVLTDKVIDRLYQIYFSDGDSIANHDILKKAVLEVGMDEVEVENILTSSQFENQVRTDEAEANHLGIHAAPFFVIDDKYGISGAQPFETMVKALITIRSEENLATK